MTFTKDEAEKLSEMISAIWDRFNLHNEEYYVTDEYSSFADKVEILTNYIANNLNDNE